MKVLIPFLLSLLLKLLSTQLCEQYFTFNKEAGQLTELNEYLVYYDPQSSNISNITCYQDALDYDGYSEYCQSIGWQTAWIESIEELDFIYSKLSTGVYRMGALKNISESWETWISANLSINPLDVILCENHDPDSNPTIGLLKSENQSCFETLEQNITEQFICKRRMFHQYFIRFWAS
jgi:hypothetical protein